MSRRETQLNIAAEFHYIGNLNRFVVGLRAGSEEHLM